MDSLCFCSFGCFFFICGCTSGIWPRFGLCGSEGGRGEGRGNGQSEQGRGRFAVAANRPLWIRQGTEDLGDAMGRRNRGVGDPQWPQSGRGQGDPQRGDRGQRRGKGHREQERGRYAEAANRSLWIRELTDRMEREWAEGAGEREIHSGREAGTG